MLPNIWNIHEFWYFSELMKWKILAYHSWERKTDLWQKQRKKNKAKRDKRQSIIYILFKSFIMQQTEILKQTELYREEERDNGEWVEGRTMQGVLAIKCMFTEGNGKKKKKRKLGNEAVNAL